MVSGGKKRIKDLRSSSSSSSGSELRASGAHPSHTRTIVWQSSLHHDKSRHREIISGHALNQQLEVCLPTPAGVELAQALKWETSFFYEVTAPLALLLSRHFVREYVLQGSVYMIAKNVPIDSSNSAMLLPSGELLLLVDADTYEQLGLVGEKYGSSIPKECQGAAAYARQRQRYVVVLDLKSKAFASDEPSSVRDRVVQCLEARFAPLTMLICAYNERGSARTLIFGDDDTIERKRVEVNGEWTHLKDIALPQFAAFFSSAVSEATDSSSNTEPRKTRDELLASLQQAYDWLGLVACRLTDLLQLTPPEEYVSTFTGAPDLFELVRASELATVRWRGLIAPEFCTSVVERAAHAVKTGKVPWAAVLVWGFPDALVSWTQRDARSGKSVRREHGFVGSGGNHYSLLLLPNDEYFLLQALGPHDASV